MTDAAAGRLLTALEPLAAPFDSPDEAIEPMRQRVMGFFAVAVDERISSQSSSVAKPPSFEAYAEFDQGLEIYMWSPGSPGAIPHFRRAFELDSTFVDPLIYAINIYNTGGQLARSDSLVRVLERHGDRLTEYERHWLGYLKARVDGDNVEALRAIRRAAELAPGSKAVYNQAYAALHFNNRPREARDALLSVDPERGQMRGFRSYWNVLTQAHHMLGEHEQELEAALRCRELHPLDERCLDYQAAALAALGRVQEVAAVLDELQPTPRVSDWPWLLEDIVDFLRYHGHSDAAKDAAERAIKWFEGRPQSEANTAGQRYYYARALYLGGRVEEAQSVFDALVDEYPEETDFRTQRGFIAAVRGDTALALSDADSLEIQVEELEGRQKDAARWRCRGVIYGALGDRERAIELFRQFEPQWFHGREDLVNELFEPMRGYPPFEEFMRPKG